MRALLLNNKVVDTASVSFPVHDSLIWKTCQAIVKPGWNYDPETNTFSAPETVELTYAQSRQAEYPSITDQLDMLYWDKQHNTHVWEDAITTIKNKHPKPE